MLTRSIEAGTVGEAQGGEDIAVERRGKRKQRIHKEWEWTGRRAGGGINREDARGDASGRDGLDKTKKARSSAKSVRESERPSD